MRVVMERNNGYEVITSKERLTKSLYYLNKSVGTSPMKMAQCGAVANNILNGKVSTFCDRAFIVEEV